MADILARPRVVVAEDDPSILDLLCTRLEIAGYHTAYARDGVQALDAIRNVQPAGVLLDINMPKLDGFGVLAQLQRDPHARQVPVLVLSARNAAGDVKRCLGLGAKDYLTKPFSDNMLLSRVARLIRKEQGSQPALPPAAPLAAALLPIEDDEDDAFLI